MTTTVDTHRCLTGSACRRADTIDNKRCGALTEQANTLCPACTAHIKSAVTQLPKDWTELRAALGERSPTAQLKISSTPTPAIPISTRKEALMAAIVDMADRAAAIVSDALRCDQPDTSHGRRRYCGRHTAHEQATLTACIAMVQPCLDLITAAPAAEHVVWRADGEGFQWAHLSGVDIALQLVELHNQARAELGLTRLRHRYPMPCPGCGGQVGRDDGQTIITCDDRDTCRGSWTEREYQFLAGLITHERLDMEILKWLLAEAYWRLDTLQIRANILKGSPDELRLPGAGPIIMERIADITDTHPTPAQRAIATDRKATQERQTGEDNWAWRNETPYQPPKAKPRKATSPVGAPIHPSSLTTLVDIDENAVINGDARCPECNIIHAGDCP